MADADGVGGGMFLGVVSGGGEDGVEGGLARGCVGCWVGVVFSMVA